MMYNTHHALVSKPFPGSVQKCNPPTGKEHHQAQNCSRLAFAGKHLLPSKTLWRLQWPANHRINSNQRRNKWLSWHDVEPTRAGCREKRTRDAWLYLVRLPPTRTSRLVLAPNVGHPLLSLQVKVDRKVVKQKNATREAVSGAKIEEELASIKK